MGGWVSYCFLAAFVTSGVLSINYETVYIQDDYYCDHGNPIRYIVSASQPNGLLVATDQNYYQPNKTCKITLQAENGYKLTTRFMEINIYNKKSEDDSKDSRSKDESKDSKMKCTEDRLQIKGEKDSGDYCGSKVPSASIYSAKDYLTFEFRTKKTPPNKWTGFKLSYTLYRTGSSCNDGEYKCVVQNRCIPDDLVCDDVDNCGDWSDEITCGWINGVAGLAVLTCLSIFAFFLIVVICSVLCKKCSTKNDAQGNRLSRHGSSVAPSPADNTNPGADAKVPSARSDAPPPYDMIFICRSSSFSKPPDYEHIHNTILEEEKKKEIPVGAASVW